MQTSAMPNAVKKSIKVVAMSSCLAIIALKVDMIYLQ